MKKWTGNDIGVKGASKISELLMINTTFTQLDLSGNWNATINKEWIVTKNVFLMNWKNEQVTILE